MKKTALVLAGFMLAGAALSLTGCDNGGSIGKIDGNFKDEATKEQIFAATTDINMNQSFDTANGFGLELNTEFDFSVNTKTTYQNQTGESKVSGDLNAEYKFTAALPEGEQVPVFLGAGNFGMNMKMNNKIAGANTTTETKASANMYNDSQYVYLDAKFSDTPMTVKFSIEDLLGQIGGNGQLPGLPGEDELLPAPQEVGDITTDGNESDTEDGTEYNLSTVLANMQEKGFKVYLDTSKGVKVKVSTSQDMVNRILSQIELEVPTDALEFSACVFDIYMAFGEDGKFTQVGIDIDIAVSVDLEIEGVATSTTFNMKGGVSLKTYAGTVTLPEGIANDEKYELKSFN